MSSGSMQACNSKKHTLCNTRDFGRSVCHKAHTDGTTRAIASADVRKGLLEPLASGLGLQAKCPRRCGISRNPEDGKYQPGKKQGPSLWGGLRTQVGGLCLCFLVVQPRLYNDYNSTFFPPDPIGQGTLRQPSRLLR